MAGTAARSSSPLATAAVPIPGYSASSSTRQSSQATHIEVGVGSSFLKMFVGNAAEMMFLPRGYTIEPEHLSKHWFSISAPSGSVYKVWMESYLDGLVLRNGWSDLMDREGVSQGDIGVFTHMGSLAFSLTVMTRGGLQKKPVYRQPEQRSPVVRWEDVKFFTSKGLRCNHALVGALYSLWAGSKQPFILYAARMKQSDVENNGSVSFTKEVSTRLPAGPAKIGLVLDGSRLIFEGIIQKWGDQVVRINGGWIDFARANHLQVGRVYVYKFEICDRGWQVTLHQV